MSATNAVPLNISSKITLSGSQTWIISDASSNITSPPAVLPLPAAQNHNDRYSAFDANEDEDLYFNALVQGTPFNLGGFTLTLTNTGSTVIDQGYTVSNGTINVNQGSLVFQGGKSRQTTISSNVTINLASNATLRFQTTSGAIVSSAAINLGNGSLLNLAAAGTEGDGIVSNIIAVSGTRPLARRKTPSSALENSITNLVAAAISGASGTTLNILPTQSGTATCLLQLSGNNSGFSGTFNIDAVTGIQPVEFVERDRRQRQCHVDSQYRQYFASGRRCCEPGHLERRGNDQQFNFGHHRCPHHRRGQFQRHYRQRRHGCHLAQ